MALRSQLRVQSLKKAKADPVSLDSTQLLEMSARVLIPAYIAGFTRRVVWNMSSGKEDKRARILIADRVWSVEYNGRPEHLQAQTTVANEQWE